MSASTANPKRGSGRASTRKATISAGQVGMGTWEIKDVTTIQDTRRMASLRKECFVSASLANVIGGTRSLDMVVTI